MVRHQCEGMVEDVDEWKSPYCDDNINETNDETNDLNFEEYRLSTFNFWPVSFSQAGIPPQLLIFFFFYYLTAQITSRHCTLSWLWIFVSYG